jgi:hypothetical protein
VADLQVPISCAGVAVYPGDVIHGDADNITVVPAALAAEMADLCEAQDDLEAYLALRVQRGEALWGLYPPGDATRASTRPGWPPAAHRAVKEPRPRCIPTKPPSAATSRPATPADHAALVSCFTPDAVHYFPPGLPDIPWRGADTIAAKWVWCVENLGSQWTIEKVLVSGDEAVIEWTHWKRPGHRPARRRVVRVQCRQRPDPRDPRLLCSPRGERRDHRRAGRLRLRRPRLPPGMPMTQALTDSTPEQIDAAVHAAQAAAAAYGASSASTRSALLRALATALEAQRDTLVPLADAESHLGPARLNGELDRTCFQLRGFADQVDAGAPFTLIDDPAVAGAPPAGRPHLTRVRVPVGPVAMFAASNFPFAFSVLGGDTASALAAGCPVVVKSHPGHPQLSRATVALAQQVVAQQGLPAGVFGAVEGAGVDVGVNLVRHPGIAAVAFTGSLRGGAALNQVAQQRPVPIPFYGELGSNNPIVALPATLAANGAALASTLAGSITLGCGQFCTSPGVIVVRDDDAGQAFVTQLTEALAAATPHAMLHGGIRAGFDAGVARFRSQAGVQALLSPAATDGPPRAHLYR